jgi:hypothetical protein
VSPICSVVLSAVHVSVVAGRVHLCGGVARWGARELPARCLHPASGLCACQCGVDVLAPRIWQQPARWAHHAGASVHTDAPPSPSAFPLSLSLSLSAVCVLLWALGDPRQRIRQQQQRQGRGRRTKRAGNKEAHTHRRGARAVGEDGGRGAHCSFVRFLGTPDQQSSHEQPVQQQRQRHSWGWPTLQ